SLSFSSSLSPRSKSAARFFSHSSISSFAAEHMRLSSKYTKIIPIATSRIVELNMFQYSGCHQVPEPTAVSNNQQCAVAANKRNRLNKKGICKQAENLPWKV